MSRANPLTIGRCVPAAWRTRDGQEHHGGGDMFILPRVRDALPVPRVSFPAARAAVCLADDCGHVFEIGGTCPSCGGVAFVPLDSFFKPRDENADPLPWKAGRGPVV